MEEKPKTIEISTRTILTTIFIVLGLVALYVIRDIVLLFLVAFTLAAALEPLVSAAYRKIRLPRALTVLLVYIFVLGAVGSFFYFLTPSFIDQFKQLGEQYQEFTAQFLESNRFIQEFLGNVNVDEAVKNFFGNIASTPAGAVEKTVGFFSSLFGVIAVLIISFYLVVEQSAIKDALRQVIPPYHRQKATTVVTAIQKKLGFWLLGQLIISMTIFAVTYLILSLLDVNLALALAGLAGIMEIVPFLGPFIAAVPAILIAFTQSPTLAILVLVAYIIIQQAEGYILVPKIMEKTVGLHPLVVLFAILIGFKLAGIIGALLAVPVVAASSVLIEAYVMGETPKMPPSPEEYLKKSKKVE